ncbi:MAG: hydrogenase maturation nickel metallochaperone HypA [Vicinamibacterales bacterium]
MHELSLAHSILDLVRDHVPPERGAEVRAVAVRVGAQAGVIADSLAFCFDAIVQGTPYGGARLVVRPVPATSRCATCGVEFPAAEAFARCPACGSARVAYAHGRELDVAEIELGEPRELTP